MPDRLTFYGIGDSTLAKVGQVSTNQCGKEMSLGELSMREITWYHIKLISSQIMQLLVCFIFFKKLILWKDLVVSCLFLANHPMTNNFMTCPQEYTEYAGQFVKELVEKVVARDVADDDAATNVTIEAQPVLNVQESGALSALVEEHR